MRPVGITRKIEHGVELTIELKLGVKVILPRVSSSSQLNLRKAFERLRIHQNAKTFFQGCDWRWVEVGGDSDLFMSMDKVFSD